MVEVGGQKMSKSLKNFTTLTDLLDRHDPRAYRLLVLRAHYRRPMEVSPDTMVDAEMGLARLDAFARHFADTAAAPDQAYLDKFRDLMDDDLNTPGATAVLFDAITDAHKGDERAAAAAFEIAGALGLSLSRSPVVIDAETQQLVTERDSARQRKDYATSDRIRDELQARGWVVEDGPSGTLVHR
jgi:cysteinyl-tRNA synthetase